MLWRTLADLFRDDGHPQRTVAHLVEHQQTSANVGGRHRNNSHFLFFHFLSFTIILTHSHQLLSLSFILSHSLLSFVIWHSETFCLILFDFSRFLFQSPSLYFSLSSCSIFLYSPRFSLNLSLSLPFSFILSHALSLILCNSLSFCAILIHS